MTTSCGPIAFCSPRACNLPVLWQSLQISKRVAQAGTRPSHRDGSCCFELLGYDIMVDRNYKAWLVEVNHSPSFGIDTPLDASIKTALIVNTLKMVCLCRPQLYEPLHYRIL